MESNAPTVTTSADHVYANAMASRSLLHAYATTMRKWLIAAVAITAICFAIFAWTGTAGTPYAVIGILIFIGMVIVQPLQIYTRLKKEWSRVAPDRTGWVAEFGAESFSLLPPFGGSKIMNYSALRGIRVSGHLVEFAVAPSEQILRIPLSLIPNADVGWLRSRADQ